MPLKKVYIENCNNFLIQLVLKVAKDLIGKGKKSISGWVYNTAYAMHVSVKKYISEAVLPL